MAGELVGSFFKAWRLNELIGAGGDAEVYRGVRADTNARCAVKVLTPKAAANKDQVKAFAKEIAILGGLEHSGFPRLFAEGTVQDRPCFSMQLIEGGSLRYFLDTGRAFDRIGCLMSGAALVAQLHGAAVIHGDVKLENFLLPDDGRLRLIDFGNARSTGGTAIFKRMMRGPVRGTPSYLAPELIKGKPPSYGSDVYAFGVAAWYLLAEKSPFTGTKAEILSQAVRCQAPGIKRAQPLLPLGLARIIDRCLMRDPDMRFTDCAEVATALKLFFRQPESPRPQALARDLQHRLRLQRERQGQAQAEVNWLDD
ncbi:MAG: serine/threonine protein kinase [Planctomycetota bacterium]